MEGCLYEAGGEREGDLGWWREMDALPHSYNCEQITDKAFFT